MEANQNTHTPRNPKSPSGQVATVGEEIGNRPIRTLPVLEESLCLRAMKRVCFSQGKNLQTPESAAELLQRLVLFICP